MVVGNLSALRGFRAVECVDSPRSRRSVPGGARPLAAVQLITGTQTSLGGGRAGGHRLNARDLILCERQPNRFRRGPEVNQFGRDDFVLFPTIELQGIADLMAVDTARDNLAVPVRFQAVLAVERRDVHWFLE
jgi:hypothetical protein